MQDISLLQAKAHVKRAIVELDEDYDLTRVIAVADTFEEAELIEKLLREKLTSV